MIPRRDGELLDRGFDCAGFVRCVNQVDESGRRGFQPPDFPRLRTLVVATLTSAIGKRRLRENRCDGDDAMRNEEKAESRKNNEPLHGQSPLFHPDQDNRAEGGLP